MTVELAMTADEFRTDLIVTFCTISNLIWTVPPSVCHVCIPSNVYSVYTVVGDGVHYTVLVC